MDFMHPCADISHLRTLLTSIKSLLTNNKLMASKRSYCNGPMALQTDTCL